MRKKRVVLAAFRKYYGLFSLRRHAILEVTSSIQIHTLLGYLQTKRKNFEIKAIEIFYMWPDEILDKDNTLGFINEYAPDIIAVSLLSVDYGAFEFFKREVELNSKKKIIWICGGYLPTIQPDNMLLNGFDFVIKGHGEIPLFKLLEYLSGGISVSFKEIPGLVWKDNDEIQSNPPKIYREEESKVKLMYEPFNPEYYIKESWQLPPVSEQVYMTTWFSRGCPFKCNFCLNNEMNQGVQFFRSPEIVIEEILELEDRYGVNFVFFGDENFLLDIIKAKELLNLLITKSINRRLRFTFMTGTNTLAQIIEKDREILPMIKEAGCEEIQYGVESGTQYMLNRMNKKASIENSYKVFESTYENGMSAAAMMVLGYEGENLNTLEETKKFIFSLKPDRISLFFAVPFQKTRLFMENEEKLQGLPYFFYDSDFPVFRIDSLERDLQHMEPVDYFIELNDKYFFKKYNFELNQSQLFLLKYREELMYDYFSSQIFKEKQRGLFLKRINGYKEDKNKLLKAGNEWFEVLGRSIANKNLTGLLQGF